MNFHAIGPVEVMHELPFREHKHHMALAQYLYDDEYFNMIRDYQGEHGGVILDSGVYEGSAVDDRQLLYWLKKLQPFAVILPDKPHDMKETLRKSLNFADLMDNFTSLAKVKRLKVLHATTLEDFNLSYLYDSRVFDGVCFSRLTKDFGRGLTRFGYINHLQAHRLWRSSAYHHCLGMQDGDMSELHKLRIVGVNSIDSSAPIWRGCHGHSLRAGVCTPFHIDFNPFYSPNGQTDVAKENFRRVVAACQELS